MYQKFSLQLFIKRMRVASNTKKTALQQIVANFMSDEEDGEGSQESVWVVKSPLWHSPQLSSLLKRLQEKIDNQPSAFSHLWHTFVAHIHKIQE